MTLLLSILALIAGPFVYALGRRRPSAREALDGFVFITIAGIVCVFIVPTAIDAGGLMAVLSLVLGLGFPVAVERLFARSLHEAHVFIVLLAVLGLVVHAMLDGIALLPLEELALDNSPRGNGLFGSLFGNQLALGVVLHRLPVGMAIWWSVRTSFGRRAAVATFALIIAATSVAYFAGQPVVRMADLPLLASFQAFVAGSLVHVVAFGISHDHDHDPDGTQSGALAAAPNTWAYRAGILLGMFVVFTVPHLHD